MKYIYLILLTIIMSGCASNPYNISMTPQYSTQVQKLYMEENLGTTWCILGNANTPLKTYDLQGIAPSSACTSMATLKVSKSCNMNNLEKDIARKEFGNIYIMQCGPKEFKIYGKENNMSKGYTYEI